MTATVETQVWEAWEALAGHGFTCAECRNPNRVQGDAFDCPTELELYRVWKRLWDRAGRPVGIPAEVSA